MHVPGLVYAIGVLIGGSVAGFTQLRKWLDRRRTRRALLAAPAIAVSVAEGVAVRVTGKVRIADEELVAPLSGRRCVAYLARMFTPEGMFGGAHTEWTDQRAVSFVIVESDGRRVAVDSAHVKLDIPPLPLPPGSGARCDQFAAKHNLTPRLRKRVFFDEVVIIEEMRVSVGGALLKDAPGAPTATERAFREDQEPALSIGGNAAHPILIAVPVTAAVQRDKR